MADPPKLTLRTPIVRLTIVCQFCSGLTLFRCHTFPCGRRSSPLVTSFLSFLVVVGPFRVDRWSRGRRWSSSAIPGRALTTIISVQHRSVGT